MARRYHRRLGTLALVELVLLSVLLAPAAVAETDTTGLSASASLVGLGETVRLTGSLTADPGCTAGRTVTLQWRPADSDGFANVGSGTTATDGSFAFDQSQPHTGRYRATLPEQGGCLGSTSNQVLVRVRAAVDAALVAGSTEAGDCADLFASVEPARPGQVVDVQRRRAARWRTIERLTLDDASEARYRACFSFDDIGVVRLRVRWVAQDVLNETARSPVIAFEVTRSAWMQAIDHAVGSRQVSIAVGDEDLFLYRQAATTPRIPASNEKLLLAMAMYDTFGPAFRIETTAAVSGMKASGAVEDLWILGRGDPLLDRRSLAALAREVAAAGITRVNGRVLGSTSHFRRDWDAPGWNEVARDYVNRPTALAFERNERADPERQAASALTQGLEELGVRVGGRPGAGPAPAGLEPLASVTSRPLQHLLRKTLRPSDNFIAETLGKGLAAETVGVPGTIAKAAAAIAAWTDAQGSEFSLHDSSGLSYANRVTAEGIVRLLWVAEDRTWGSDLRRALPTGGQGTLVHRLRGVDVRAKTGTLQDVSALSGWVRSSRTGAWVEFSILCSGMSKSTASSIEDRIVRILHDDLP